MSGFIGNFDSLEEVIDNYYNQDLAYLKERYIDTQAFRSDFEKANRSAIREIRENIKAFEEEDSLSHSSTLMYFETLKIKIGDILREYYNKKKLFSDDVYTDYLVLLRKNANLLAKNERSASEITKNQPAIKAGGVSKKRKKRTPKYGSFKLQADKNPNFNAAHNILFEHGYIDCKREDFERVFSGENLDGNKVNWIGGLSDLHYFIDKIKVLIEDCNEGIWRRTAACFQNKGEDFTNKEVCDSHHYKNDTTSLDRAVNALGASPKGT